MLFHGPEKNLYFAHYKNFSAFLCEKLFFLIIFATYFFSIKTNY